MLDKYRLFASIAVFAFCAPIFALEPDQVYRRAAPSVVMVFAANSKVTMQGSGVVVGPERIVTNCHVVLDKGGKPYPKLVIRQINAQWPARFITARLDYDTCLLAVPGLPTPPVRFADSATLRVGQRVYAIGSPIGLELTLTDGLLSAFRLHNQSRVIQTSAPISHGSSGGGLFDDQARLVGITSFGLKDGNSLGFAYFADPIISLVSSARDEGGKAAMANSVQAALSKATADTRPTVSSFKSTEQAVKWLSTMDEKLGNKVLDKEYRLDLLRSVHYEATRAGLDPQLVLGLIDTVSEFRKVLVGKKGARGYMQVQPAWVELVGRPDDNLFDLRTNLRYGCTILRHYLDANHGDLYLALMHYEVAMLKGPGHEVDEASDFPNRVRSKWQDRWLYSP